MSNLGHKCAICLQPGKTIWDLSRAAEDGDSWSSKLGRIVPEVDWSDTFKICIQCAHKVDEICQFRKLCIKLDAERQLLVTNCQQDSDHTGNYQSDYDNNFECNKCGEKFQKYSLWHNHETNCVTIVYRCFHCNRGFRNKSSLAKHIHKQHKRAPDLAENQDKTYTCDKCGKTYQLQKAFATHIVACTAVKTHPVTKMIGYECNQCKKLYTTAKIMKAHRKKCVVAGGVPKRIERKSNRVFSCEVCGLEMNFAKSIVSHCVNDHGMDLKLVKPYGCKECSMRFVSSANLIQHKKYHEGSRNHICSFCGKTYITKSDLTVHEYTHFNRRNYKCGKCDKAFNTNKNLRSHNLVVHTAPELWKYMCSSCDKRFPLKSGYEQHMRRHSGDKRFTCHICSKSFISRSELQRHTNNHSKVRAHKCQYCDKAYKERRMYEVHLTKAHGIGDAKLPVRIKKFVCHVCAKSFFNNHKLMRHLCTHTGIKPFECHLCSRKFSDRYYMKQHWKTAHDVVHVEEPPSYDIKEDSVDMEYKDSVEIDYKIGLKYATLT